MRIFDNTYYILIFILCKLFVQNQALEDNARSENKDSASLNLIQNFESLRNFVKRDEINSPITEIKETENLEKREIKKIKKSKRKVVKKKKSKKSIKKKTLKNKTKIPEGKKKTTKSSTKKKSSKKKTKQSSSKKLPSKKPKKTTPKTTTTTLKPSQFCEWKSLIYYKVNGLRHRYHAKKLIINDALANLAQKLADKYAQTSLKKLKAALKKNTSYGAMFYRVEISEKYSPISKWKLGAAFVDFKRPEKSPAGLDFTQLIWISTEKIGCGISYIPSKKRTLTVCLFYPKGNIKGQFAKNIHDKI